MTKREDLLAEAAQIVEQTDLDLLDNGELKLIVISEDVLGNTIATIRGADNIPIIVPHPESQSILVARQVYFDLLTKGPRIIRELTDLVENSADKVPNKANKDEVSA